MFECSKRHWLQFLESCLWWQSAAVSADSHAGPDRLLAEGEPQSHGVEHPRPAPSTLCNHTRPAHSAVASPNPSDLFTVIQRDFLLSQSPVHLCLGDAKGIYYLVCWPTVVSQMMPVSLFCVRISDDVDHCISKSGPGWTPPASLELVRNAEFQKRHPWSTAQILPLTCLPRLIPVG